MYAESSAESAVLVETGAFRIDRSKALEKLRDFQLERAEDFLLPWIRCAVVSGAERIEIRTLPDGLELSFGGRPFRPADLEDPYAALFEEAGPETARMKHFAAGLLGALRVKPERVTLASGRYPDRVLLDVESVEDEDVRPDPTPCSETVVTVLWGGTRFWGLSRWANSDLASACLDRVRESCGLLDVPLYVDGERVPVFPESQGIPWVECRGETSRGYAFAAPRGGEPRVYLYKHGVLAGWYAQDLPLIMTAHVNDDGFRLTASHSSVLRDERYRRAVRLVKSNARVLLRRACEEQTKRAREWARDFMSVHGLGDRPPGWLLGVRFLLGRLGKSKREDFDRADREATVSGWLRREAAGKLAAYETDAGQSALKALWRTPLYVSVTGKPLSLYDLLQQYKRIGRVPCSDPTVGYPDPWVLGFEPSVDIVWRLDPLDVCLSRLFRDSLVEWQAYHTVWELAKLPFRRNGS